MCFLEFNHPFLVSIFGNKVDTYEDFLKIIQDLQKNPVDVIASDRGTYGGKLVGFMDNLNVGLVEVGSDLLGVDIGFLAVGKYTEPAKGNAPAEAISTGVETNQVIPVDDDEIPIEVLLRYDDDVKLYPNATTRQDIETGIQLKISKNNEGQRSLLRFLSKNTGYVLVGVKNGPGINADAEATEVLIAVPVGSTNEPDLLSVAVKVDGEVYGLTFEDGTVEDASFFGNKGRDENSRTTQDHQTRLSAVAREQKISIEEADALLKDIFNRLQESRQKIKNGERVLFEYNVGNEGYYPKNNKTFLELDQGTDSATSFNPENISIKEGIPEANIVVEGKVVTVQFKPTKFKDAEINWLLNNFGNWSDTTVAGYNLLIGLRKKPLKHHIYNNQLFYTDKDGQSSPVTKEQFSEWLNENPYRDRGTILATAKEVVYLGKTMSTQTYVRNHFAPRHGFWKKGKRFVTDKANGYLMLTEVDSFKAEALDDYITPLRDNLKPAYSEVYVNPGYEVEVNGETITLGVPDKSGRVIKGVYVDNTIYVLSGDNETLVHERIHANTVDWIRQNPESEEVAELNGLLEKARQLPNPSAKVQYYLQSIEEFIAGGLSNPEMIEFLSQMDSKDSKTWWETLAEIISRIAYKYGVPIKSETYLKLLDIYDRIQVQDNSNSVLDAFFNVEFVDPEFSFTIETQYDKVLFARSMDSLMVNFLNSGVKKVSIEHLQRTLVKKPDLFESLYDAFIQDLKKNDIELSRFYLKNEATLRNLWLSRSILFTLDTSVDEEDKVVDKKEQGDNVAKEGFDKRGNETAALDLVDMSIKSMISLLPAKEVNKFGVKELMNVKDVYYTLLDAFDGQITLEGMLEVLYTMPEYRLLFERLNVNYTPLGIVFPKDNSSQMLLSKFWQAFNKPALPFTTLIQEQQYTTLIQETGVNTQNVKERVLYNQTTKMKELGFNESQTIDYMRKLLLNKDYDSFVRLLGFTNNKLFASPDYSAWKNRQDWSSWLELLSTPDIRIKDFSNVKGKALNSLINIYAQNSDIQKTRMARNANGDPVSSDTLPNTLTALVHLYNSNQKDNADHRLGYMKHPVYKYTMSASRLEQGEKIKLIAYGGIKEKGDTVDLSPSDWISMNIETMFNNGMVEMMRTETSSSSWAFGFGGLWVQDKASFLEQMKNYLRGEVERVKMTRTGFKYYNQSFSLFDYLPPLEDMSTEDYIQLAEPFIEQWIDKQTEVNTRMLTDYSVSVSEDIRKRYPNFIELFTYNYIIHNIEESILFNGGLEWYKDFHKRAKGKISTGSTPIPDIQWWDNLSPNDMLSGYYHNKPVSPVLDTFLVTEHVVSYKSGKVKDNQYIPGSPEFETIFQKAVETLMSRYKTLRVDIDYITAVNKLLPKYKSYSNMEAGDGQGWINLDYYRIIQMSTGNWPQEAEDLFQWEKIYYKRHFLNIDLTEQELTVYKNRPNYQYVPAKYSYMGPEENGIPVFDKFALMPLIPSVVHKTKWQPVLEHMVENRLAYAKHTSGTKVAQRKGQGYMIPSDVLNGQMPNADQIYKIHASLLKEQLKTDPKLKKENTFGTQFRKLVFQDTKEFGVWLDLDTTGFEADPNWNRLEYFKNLKKFQDSLSQEELNRRSPIAARFKKYKSLISELVEIERQSLYEELGYKNGKIVNIPAFIKTLEEKTLEKNEAVREFLAILKANPEEFVIKMEAGPNKQTFEKMITGLVNQRLLRPKAPGSQLIQVASTGFVPLDWEKPSPEDYEKYGQTGLRYYQVKDGKVLPAQIKITLNGQYEFLYNDPKVKELVKSGLTRLDAVNTLLKDPEWFEAHKSALTVVAYRIPTQGLSSMEVFEIAEFLPKSAGKIIIPPIEIVAKSGGDFDIDKMSLFVPNLDKSGNLITSLPEGTYSKQVEKDIKKRLKENKKKINEATELIKKSKSNKAEILAIKQFQDLFNFDIAETSDLEEYNTKNRRLRKLFKEQTEIWVGLNALFAERRKLMEEQDNLYILKKGKKALLENQLLEVIQNQILTLENYHLLTTPLGTDILKEKLVELGTLNNRTPENPNPLADPKDSKILTLETSIAKRLGMLVNKKLLGIAAVANTYNQLYNRVDFKLPLTYFLIPQLLTQEERKLVSDNNFIYVGSQLTVDGELKSEIYNQNVNATVDGAKEDYLGYANYTFTTFPVMMYLTMQGVPFKKAAEFINAKSIREVTVLERKNDPAPVNTLLSEKLIELGLTRYVGENNKIDDVKNIYLELSAEFNVDLSNVDFRNLTKEEELVVLLYFKVLQEEGSYIFDLQRKTNRDTSTYQNVYNTMFLKDSITVLSPDAILNDTEIAAFNVSDEYLDIMKSIFTVNYDPAVMLAISEEGNKVKSYNKEAFYRRASNDFVEYLIKTRGEKDGMSLGEWGIKSTESLPVDTVLFIMDNPDVRKTKFFTDLQFTRDFQLLFLKRDVNDVAYNDVYTNEIQTLYEKYPEFMGRLLLTAFLQTGFNRTYFSFADLIPPSILKDTLNSTLQAPVTREEIVDFITQFNRYNDDLYNDVKKYQGYKSYLSNDDLEIPDVQEEVTLTAAQAEAVEDMLRFVKYGSTTVPYILEGKAGTGKTTTTIEFIKQLKGNVLVGAISNQATEVIGGKIENYAAPVTVAQILGIHLNMETNKFQPDKKKRPLILSADYVIIDEASMMNEELYEYMMSIKPKKTKVFLIRDMGQLGPIRDITSPYYADKKELIGSKSQISSEFGYKLYERIRQGEESPILPYADYFWKNNTGEAVLDPAAGKRISIRSPKGNLLFTRTVNYDSLAKQFRLGLDQNNPNHIRIITYRNATKERYNKEIHQRLFGNVDFASGEILIFNDTFIADEQTFSNSSVVTVNTVSEKTQKDGFTGYEATVLYKDTIFPLFLLDPAGKAKFMSEVDKRMKEAAGIQDAKLRAEAFAEAYAFKESFPNVDYGYAITSHKSQGSTYNISVVDEADILSVGLISNREKSESIYVGATRAKYGLLIISNAVSENLDDYSELSILPEKEIATDIKELSQANVSLTEDLRQNLSSQPDVDSGMNTTNVSPASEQIYMQLGNKTASGNVQIKSVYQNEGQKYAESIGGVFSMRVNNSNTHFGNPFSSVPSEIAKGLIPTKSTRESVERYIDWIINDNTTDGLLNSRVEWIREQLRSGALKNKPIVYYKELGEPSHATALDYLINKYDWEESPYSLAEITNHSGGAVGADSMFDIIGREFGVVNHNHYYHGAKTPKGNVALTNEQVAEGIEEAKKAATVMGRPWNDEFASLLGRNWYQVKNATQVIAIAPLIKPGDKNKDGYVNRAKKTVVDGGTGYAVEMAIANDKEVYVFDINTNTWFYWDGSDYIESTVPVLHKNFAGIGSRQNKGKMTPESIQAIRDVYQNTKNAKQSVRPDFAPWQELFKPSLEQKLESLMENSKYIVLTEDESQYIDTRTGEKYDRVTHFLDGKVPMTPLLQTASNLGNKVDKLVRDYFSGAPLVNDISTTENFIEFIKQLDKVKAAMDSRGEKVIANGIVVYDRELKIAGTVDLLTYDSAGVVRMYDVKSMKGDQFNTTYADGISKYDTELYGKSKRTKHTEQLSMYRMLLYNTNDIMVSTIGILPVQLDYNIGDQTSTTLRMLKGVKLDPMDKIKNASLKTTYTAPDKPDIEQTNSECDGM